MSYPFNLKFVIFNESEDVSQEQKDIKKHMIISGNLKNILENSFRNDTQYKLLEGNRLIISSVDEKKQLRMVISINHLLSIGSYKHSIDFHQGHCQYKEYFSLEELKYISQKIKNGLEEYLSYEIDESILYIDVNHL